MPEVDAVILAAGLSQRMGRNKLLLPLAGTTMFHHFLSRFPFGLFDRTVVVAAARQVMDICKGFPVTACPNDAPELGQSHSIHLGLKATAEDHATLFCVADQPLLLAETITRLVKMADHYPDNIIQPRVGTRPANPVIFPADLRPELAGLTGDSGGREIIQRHIERVKWLELDCDDQFLDVDTPEQYRKLLDQWPLHH